VLITHRTHNYVVPEHIPSTSVATPQAQDTAAFLLGPFFTQLPPTLPIGSFSQIFLPSFLSTFHFLLSLGSCPEHFPSTLAFLWHCKLLYFHITSYPAYIFVHFPFTTNNLKRLKFGGGQAYYKTWTDRPSVYIDILYIKHKKQLKT